MTIEKLHPGIYTCAQLLDRKNNLQLKVAGVEDVIVADEVASHLIATSARNLGSVDVLSELLTVQIGNQFYKIALPESWVGISFWESAERLKDSFDTILIAIERQKYRSKETLVNPSQDTPLLSGDLLVVIARSLPQINCLPRSKKRKRIS
ncbi:hypothetical protein [Lyngbya aestuarii]|uniref:hypothetical protein n=1 Tax=Lyngbya aestuarii TaxID=118322 RepID=UPI00403E0408